MRVKPRRNLLGRCDDQVFAYAGLFLLSAGVSALGGSLLGLLVFIPSALAAALIGSRRA